MGKFKIKLTGKLKPTKKQFDRKIRRVHKAAMRNRKRLRRMRR